MNIKDVQVTSLDKTFYNPVEITAIFSQHDIDLKGVIHVGAHIGLEYENYIDMGFKKIVFFEPLENVFSQLVTRITGNPPEKDSYHVQYGDVEFYNQALGNTVGEIEMFVETANQGQSSSVLEPGTHLTSYPSITFDKKEKVKINKLDNFVFEDCNVLNIDVQGYELEVLKGANRTLKQIDILFTEVNTGDVYKGCAKINELDEYLKQFRFQRAYEHIFQGLNYGDAIYFKR